MPRYFFDVEDGHRLFDPTGFVCDDDIAAIIRATVLAVGISIDKPEDVCRRHADTGARSRPRPHQDRPVVIYARDDRSKTFQISERADHLR
jgi:hypothetical protein